MEILREGQAGQKTVEHFCWEHGMAQPTLLRLEAEVRVDGRERGAASAGAEKENGRLKRLLSELDVGGE